MIGRIAAAVVCAFWVVMMVSLVRMEYLGELGGTEVPAELVLQKIFSQENPARLNVLHEGQIIGFCKLDIEQRSVAPFKSPFTNVVDRLPPSWYRAHTELTVALANFGIPTRLRVVGLTQFNPDFGVESYKIFSTIGDGHIDVQGDSASQKITVDFSIGEFRDHRVFDYQQLRGIGSQNLIGMASLANMGWLSGAGLAEALPSTTNGPAGFSKKLTTVRTAQLRIAGESEDAYLIETRVDETLWAKIWVSKQGEILKVETSLRILLLADTLTEIQSRYPDPDKVEHDTH